MSRAQKYDATEEKTRKVQTADVSCNNEKDVRGEMPSALRRGVVQSQALDLSSVHRLISRGLAALPNPCCACGKDQGLGLRGRSFTPWLCTMKYVSAQDGDGMRRAFLCNCCQEHYHSLRHEPSNIHRPPKLHLRPIHMPKPYSTAQSMSERQQCVRCRGCVGCARVLKATPATWMTARRSS